SGMERFYSMYPCVHRFLPENSMATFCRFLTFFFALVPVAFGQELSIALSTPITSLDPHFHNLSPNNGMSKHFFDPLVKQDPQQNLKPGLAESWRALDETTWEFKLRKGVRFHDGSE